MGKKSKAVVDKPADGTDDDAEFKHWFDYEAKMYELQRELDEYEAMPRQEGSSAFRRLQCMDDVRRRIFDLKAKYGVDQDPEASAVPSTTRVEVLIDHTSRVVLERHAELAKEPVPKREADKKATLDADSEHTRDQVHELVCHSRTATQPGPGDDATTKLPQRREKITTLRDNDILKALRARGIDPLKMPKPPPGNKPWPLRIEVRKELNLTEVMAKEAFTRLRNDGRMRH